MTDKENEINLDELTLNLLVSHENKMYVVAMRKDKFEAIELITKQAIHRLVPTNVTVDEFVDFIEVQV